MRQAQTCYLGHRFVCAKCPVCEPDQLQALRDEKAEGDRRELERLMATAPGPSRPIRAA